MDRVLQALFVIASGLFTGWLLKQCAGSGRWRRPPDIPRLKMALQKIALLALLPVTYCGAFWNLDLRVASIYSMPLVGVFTILAGGGLALAGGRLLRLPRPGQGAFFCCGMFTNVGAIGALVCFQLLGEAGFALVPAYKLLEEVVYFGLGFPMARSFTGPSRSGLADALRRIATDPFILCALGGMGAGILLRLSGLERPPAFSTVNAVLVPLASFLMLVSIGLALRVRKLTGYPRECAAVIAIKFALVPALACSLAWALGYARAMDGTPFKVVMILSSMPVAFLALIPPSLYDLDVDMTNACWFATILFSGIAIPVLAFLTSSF